jgi:hypothetical protein
LFLFVLFVDLILVGFGYILMGHGFFY